MPYIVNAGVNWAYLAGLIDGEGYVGLIRHKDLRRKNCVIYRPTIAVCMTHLKTLEYIAEQIGRGHIYSHRQYRKNCKPTHRWYISGVEIVKAVAEQLLPYSITKRKPLEKIIEYCSYRQIQEKPRPGLSTIGQKDEEFWTLMKGINKRGVSSLM